MSGEKGDDSMNIMRKDTPKVRGKKSLCIKTSVDARKREDLNSELGLCKPKSNHSDVQ